jgi:hypothetical protein
MPVIPPPRRLTQEDLEFQINLGCVVRPCLKKIKQVRTEASLFSGPNMGHDPKFSHDPAE